MLNMSMKKMAELHLIVGCMFSGKSSELLKIISKYNRLKIPVCVVNHSLDKRYGENEIVSHDKKRYPSFQTDSLMSLKDNEVFKKSQGVFVEEGQFFNDLVSFYDLCMGNDKKLYVAGLNGDFQQNSMGQMTKLYPKCDTITKLNAMCSICLKAGKQNTAIFTKRVVDSKEVILVDSSESYIPVCRKHL